MPTGKPGRPAPRSEGTLEGRALLAPEQAPTGARRPGGPSGAGLGVPWRESKPRALIPLPLRPRWPQRLRGPGWAAQEPSPDLPIHPWLAQPYKEVPQTSEEATKAPHPAPPHSEAIFTPGGSRIATRLSSCWTGCCLLVPPRGAPPSPVLPALTLAPGPSSSHALSARQPGTGRDIGARFAETANLRAFTCAALWPLLLRPRPSISSPPRVPGGSVWVTPRPTTLQFLSPAWSSPPPRGPAWH